MKPALLIAVLLMTSCAKDDRSIQYDLSCTHCSARYLDADGVSHYIKIVPDTIFTDTDTIVDQGPYTWSARFSVDPDADLYFGAARLGGEGLTTVAKRTIDGAAESKSMDAAGDFVEFH